MPHWIFTGEYAERGQYHRHLDPHWSYYPTYLAKMRLVRQFLETLPSSAWVLDAGCGEGILVEEYRSRGMHIYGLDLNFGMPGNCLGSVLYPPYADHTFDVVLFLDVIEHLSFPDQPRALAELARVLKPSGYLMLSVPNLAHLASRWRFLLRGQLHRTAEITKHPGDRPIAEHLTLLRNAGFRLSWRRGITLTVPYLMTGLVWHNPERWLWLHRLLDQIAPADLCLVNVILAQKVTSS